MDKQLDRYPVGCLIYPVSIFLPGATPSAHHLSMTIVNIFNICFTPHPSQPRFDRRAAGPPP